MHGATLGIDPGGSAMASIQASEPTGGGVGGVQCLGLNGVWVYMRLDKPALSLTAQSARMA